MSTALNPRRAPSVAQALAHGRRLLAEAPALAASKARILACAADNQTGIGGKIYTVVARPRTIALRMGYSF